jgi:elongator complex protein 3
MRLSNPTKKDVNVVKMRISGKRRLKKVLPNSEIIRHLRPKERLKLLPILRRKTVRTISGVIVIAVVTEPYPCPHGKCFYCPGGPPHNVPSAYTGREPAIMRGLQNRFNPFFQVRNRIQQLKVIGHEVDKVEIVIMGGTFSSTPLEYQEHFIKECLDAISSTKSESLKEAKVNAEMSAIRNSGITVETRPDFAKEPHVDQMLSMGVTRVELGVQNIYEDIYIRVNRGHSVQDVIESTRILKDAGLKVCYHLMPGLPGSSFTRDLQAFQKIFRDPEFKPDMIKIYPCLVLKGTKVYEWWKKGKYKPYSTKEATRLVLEVKKIIPSWMRIMRVQRDIPAPLIDAGVDKSNLRQIVLKKLKQEGKRCRCIRCREVGHRWIKDKVRPNPGNIKLSMNKEKASEGTDIFISADDAVNDVLLGYLRLRIPSEKAHRPEIEHKITSIVRELHVFGPLVPVGKRSQTAWQHKGYGGTLLSEAERISQEDYDRKKIIVMSALGTKHYYLNRGYHRLGPYVEKVIA